MFFIACVAVSFVACSSATLQQYTCADVCQCSRNVPPQDVASGQSLRVNCRELDLTTVPSTKLLHDAWHASSIDLSKNLITRIARNTFRSQTKLVNLKLDQNDIEDIDVAAFNVSTIGWPTVRSSPLRFLNLKENNLHKVPTCFGPPDKSTAEFSNLSTLLLGGNPFGKNVFSDSFAGVRQVRRLDMSRCLITSLPPLVFKDMENVQELDLSYNSLTSFPPTAFDRDSKLSVLNLDGNSFSRIPHRVPRTIKELRMASNLIRNLTADDCFGLGRLKRLEILDLSSNGLRLYPFGSFEGLSNLKFLDLSRNELDRLTSNSFLGLKSLEYLFLHNNPFLTIVEQDSLSPVPSLRYLLLNGCSLEKISMAAASPGVRSLRYLWLHGNPINCNCEILPFVRLLRKSSIQLDANIQTVAFLAQNKAVGSIAKAKISELDPEVSPTVCAGPSNRLRKVVGRTIASVPEDYLTCPDEPLYVVVSVFLGIFLFAAAIPVVFCMIGLYLLLVRIAKSQFGWKFDDGED